MNKRELVEAIATRLDGDRKAAAAAVDGVIDEISRALVKGDRVTLTGFGTFEKRARAARTARNPATGEQIKLKKTSVPAFKAGAVLKSVVSGATKLPKAAAAPAKKAAAPAKKAAAPARKAAAKKAPAKAAAKKAPARKAAAKKAPARRGARG